MLKLTGLWLQDSDILGRSDDGIVVTNDVSRAINEHGVVWAYGRCIKHRMTDDVDWLCKVIVADGAERMTPDGPIHL